MNFRRASRNDVVRFRYVLSIVFFTLSNCRRFWESNLGLERFGSQIRDWRDLGGEFEAPQAPLGGKYGAPQVPLGWEIWEHHGWPPGRFSWTQSCFEQSHDVSDTTRLEYYD